MEVSLGEVSPAETRKSSGTGNPDHQQGYENRSVPAEHRERERVGWLLSYEVIEVEPGETVTVPLYVEVPEYRAKANDFSFTVTSEVSENEATVEGTITPPEGKVLATISMTA